MHKEPRDGGADVEAVYVAGLSGYYPSPYLTPSDLKALSDRCLTGARVISNIEAYELDGGVDVARFDLSLYGEDATQKLKSWPERAFDSVTFIEQLLLDVAKEKNGIMFQVWLDWDQA